MKLPRFMPYLLIMIVSSFAHAGRVDTDNLLRVADVQALVGNKQLLNLRAQLLNPGFVTDVNEFNDFVALASTPRGPALLSEFDENQSILSQIHYPSWVGVSQFTQKEIPQKTLQEGLQEVKACAAKVGDVLEDEISRVSIFKSLQGIMTYNYVFRAPKACQEYLYFPHSGQCEKGMKIDCYDPL